MEEIWKASIAHGIYEQYTLHTILATHWISINRRSAVDTTYGCTTGYIPQINAIHIECVCLGMYVYMSSVISLLLC